MTSDYQTLPPLNQTNPQYQQWLVNTVSQITNTIQSAVLLLSDEQYIPVANIPPLQPMHPELLSLAEKVINDQSGAVLPQENQTFLAYPVLLLDKVNAVILCIISSDDQATLSEAMTQIGRHSLQLKSLLLDQPLFLYKERLDNLTNSIELLGKTLSEPHFHAATMTFITELSVLFNCRRVSIGIVKGHSIKLLHFSHSSNLSKRMNVIRLLENAMQEAADQKQVLALPSWQENNNQVTFVHQNLLKNPEFSNHLLSIPLYTMKQQVFAVICLESEQSFSQHTTYQVESLCALSAIALHEKKLNDRWIFLKLHESFKQQFSRLFGAGFFTRKLIALLLIILTTTFSLLEGTYRLAANANIEATVQHSVVASLDGYIESADFSLGDKVKKGQLLVKLDGKDYQLEKVRIISKIAKLHRQKSKAMALNELASINIANTQIKQAEVELLLVNIQIERTSILSPMQGLLIQGDLRQRLGGNVEKGEVLFEIAPINDYKINLSIPESRITDIQLGDKGKLYLSALPKKNFNFTIVKILPNLVSDNNSAHFIAEAILQKPSNELLLGMKGVGKIYIDQRLLVSIWTREQVEFFRLLWWRWWG